MARAVLGAILGVVARLWLMTLRVELVVSPALDAVRDRPWVLAFLHGKQWPLLAWKRRRRTAVMVSLSADGQIQSRALSVLGFTVVRGSSSRGGARGLASIVRKLEGGEHDAAFAVDGPRGPYGVPKPGVFLAARRADAVLVPMGSAIVGAKTFARAWDRFALAWPFARVSVVLGPPVELGEEAGAHDVDRLAEAIGGANDAAEAILAAPHSDMVHFSRF
ncbi:MAG: putative lipoprotein [Labilithrix sp.]|nr:putative lipoprotein [Labilithrix sp.]